MMDSKIVGRMGHSFTTTLKKSAVMTLAGMMTVGMLTACSDADDPGGGAKAVAEATKNFKTDKNTPETVIGASKWDCVADAEGVAESAREVLRQRGKEAVSEHYKIVGAKGDGLTWLATCDQPEEYRKFHSSALLEAVNRDYSKDRARQLLTDSKSTVTGSPDRTPDDAVDKAMEFADEFFDDQVVADAAASKLIGAQEKLREQVQAKLASDGPKAYLSYQEANFLSRKAVISRMPQGLREPEVSAAVRKFEAGDGSDWLANAEFTAGNMSYNHTENHTENRARVELQEFGFTAEEIDTVLPKFTWHRG